MKKTLEFEMEGWVETHRVKQCDEEGKEYECGCTYIMLNRQHLDGRFMILPQIFSDPETYKLGEFYDSLENKKAKIKITIEVEKV